jgi:predicted DNA-binding mobile mystery protein A
MRNKYKLLIEQLDNKLKPFQATKSAIIPSNGWINAVRTSINMTMEQFGKRLGVTRQGVKNIEAREANGTITLNSLREAGKALDLRLVYGFIPNSGTIDNFVNKKAEELAEKIITRTNQNMKLEAQGIGDNKIDDLVKELATDIKREMKKSLWD